MPLPSSRGVQCLLQVARADPALLKNLLEHREAALDGIAFLLSPTERAMLLAIPNGQLESLIATVSTEELNDPVTPVERSEMTLCGGCAPDLPSPSQRQRDAQAPSQQGRPSTEAGLKPPGRSWLARLFGRR
jgi:hypothetical protein